jgi:hypothetical protein
MDELGVSIVTFYYCCQLYRVYNTYWATESNLNFCIVFCRSLFVLLSLFCWPFYCLSFFDLLFLVIPLVSSNLYCYSKICWISRIHESWHIQTKTLSYDMPTVDWTININQWLHTIHKGCIKIGRFYIVMSSIPRLGWIRPHNVSGDRHWLHR